VETRPIDGLLLVDKPAGITSHDVVSVARRALGTRRIGHAGTLDPFATGLLVLLVGNATRLLPYLDGEPKVYEATIAFGCETDTDDVTGNVTVTESLPDADRVREAVAQLTGEIDQVPPAYSAKQVEGQRAYAAARRGTALDLPLVRVVVHEWSIRELTPSHMLATITCGGGTYIRALARDLGRACGSAAHLASLRRTGSGTFHVASAASVDALKAGDAVVQPSLAAVSHLPNVSLSAADVIDVRHGRAVRSSPGTQAQTVALVDSASALVAIAERVNDAWQPRMVIPNA
jgi:tRNA pseudouridine55 synthase